MVIAAGHPILAADVKAAITHAQASATTAQTAATSASTVATTADAQATEALEASNTAAADASAARSQASGLQQQIDNNVAANAADATSIATHEEQLGALEARIAALETSGTGGGGPPPPTGSVPNVPTNPTSTATTQSSVSLSATAPAVGAAATFYTPRRRPAGSGSYTDAPNVTAPTVAATLSGLTASTSYDIVVLASNATGAGGQSALITRSTIAAPTTPPPTTSGPGTGPAFRYPAGNRTIVGGQRVSQNMDITDNQPGWPGRLLHGIKPYFYSGIWRNAEGGPGFFSGGTTVGWLEQGSYLYDDDIARIYSASGLPAVWGGNYPINGSRLGIRWWTYGTAANNGGVDLQLFTEPGLDNAPSYDVINDYKGPTRGDTFRTTPNVFGAGHCVQTSWGSYYDMTQDSRGPSGFGLGWVAFNGYSMTDDQIGSLGGF